MRGLEGQDILADGTGSKDCAQARPSDRSPAVIACEVWLMGPLSKNACLLILITIMFVLLVLLVLSWPQS